MKIIATVEFDRKEKGKKILQWLEIKENEFQKIATSMNLK